MAALARRPTLPLVDARPFAGSPEEVLQDCVDRCDAADLDRLDVGLQQIPRGADPEQPVTLLVGPVARQVASAGVDRLAELGGRPLRSRLLGGAYQERRAAGGHRGGHGRAVEHVIARWQGADDWEVRLPGGNGRDRRAGRNDVRLEPSILPRPAGGEGEQPVLFRYHRVVVVEPGVFVGVGPDAHHLGRYRRVAGGVDPRVAVAGREEHLRLVQVDQPVVEDGTGVVAVVERRQPADGHVDHVNVSLLLGEDHPFDHRVRGASSSEHADADRDDLRFGGGAVERRSIVVILRGTNLRVLEKVFASGDAGDVRPVSAGDDADVDEFVLPVRLHHEWNRLAGRGGGIIGTEDAHIVVHNIVGHPLFVGETVVLVSIDPDGVAGRAPEHGEDAATPRGITVAVDVIPQLTPQRRDTLVEDADSVITVGGCGVRNAAVDEAAVGGGHLVLHVDPGRVIVGQRIRVGHPIDDLARRRAVESLRGLQLRGQKVHARIEHANFDAAPVEGRVGRHELRRADVAGGHVRILARRARPRWVHIGTRGGVRVWGRVRIIIRPNRPWIV